MQDINPSVSSDRLGPDGMWDITPGHSTTLMLGSTKESGVSPWAAQIAPTYNTAHPNQIFRNISLPEPHASLSSGCVESTSEFTFIAARCNSCHCTESAVCNPIPETASNPARYEPLSCDSFTQTIWDDESHETHPFTSCSSCMAAHPFLSEHQHNRQTPADTLSHLEAMALLNGSSIGIQPVISINIDRDPALFPIILDVYR